MENQNPHICGGCSLQNMPEAEYRDYKRDMLLKAVEEAGYDAAKVEPLAWVGQGSRRRATLHVRLTKTGVELGYYQKQSHKLIPMTGCPALEPEIEALVFAFKELIPTLNCKRAFKEIHLLSSDSGLEAQIEATTGLDGSDRKALETFADAHSVARLIWRSRAGAENVVYEYPSQLIFGEVNVDLPKGAFVQASRKGQQLITDEVLAGVQGYKTVLDLYAGCGTYSFPMALAGVDVLAYEGANEMVQAVNRAVRAHEVTNLLAKRKDLYKNPVTADELAAFDAVVINPPRGGSEAQIKHITQSDIKTLVMVSCNPKTLTRDAVILREGGYALKRAVPIDQFYWTEHLESVLIFGK